MANINLVDAYTYSSTVCKIIEPVNGMLIEKTREDPVPWEHYFCQFPLSENQRVTLYVSIFEKVQKVLKTLQRGDIKKLKGVFKGKEFTLINPQLLFCTWHSAQLDLETALTVTCSEMHIQQ